MKLLVTGGAGYVGSIVARLLIDHGHEVVVFDNLERGHRAAVPSRAELHVGDITDQADISTLMRDHAETGAPFEGVLHFAALSLVGESVQRPELYYRTNVGGTLTLLEAMVEHGIPRMVFSSTAAVYGQPDRVPITEQAPTSPTNPYGDTKLAVDSMIAAFCNAHDLAAVSLRYFNVAGASHGAGEDHHPETHLIPNVLQVALGRRDHVEIFGTDYPTQDGTAIRDYIHIEDLADAHVLALEHAQRGLHQVFNLGNGSGFSVREVIAAAEQVTGQTINTVDCPRRPGDPPQLVASSDRARDELGWLPKRPQLTTMIEDAWEFAQANPAGYSRSASASSA